MEQKTTEQKKSTERPDHRSANRFTLGGLYITANASDRLDPYDVALAVIRHAHRDWGEVGPDDWEANELALHEGSRLLSVYRDRHGTAFWVITEADRSATTVLLPEDY